MAPRPRRGPSAGGGAWPAPEPKEEPFSPRLGNGSKSRSVNPTPPLCCCQRIAPVLWLRSGRAGALGAGDGGLSPRSRAWSPPASPSSRSPTTQVRTKGRACQSTPPLHPLPTHPSNHPPLSPSLPPSTPPAGLRWAAPERMGVGWQLAHLGKGGRQAGRQEREKKRRGRPWPFKISPPPAFPSFHLPVRISPADDIPFKKIIKSTLPPL